MPYGMGLISVGAEHMVAVRADGTVAAEGSNDKGQCDVGDWQDIIAVAAGEYHTVGLRSDGTVVATGYNSEGQCDVYDWTDIVQIVAGADYTAGLRANGKVVWGGTLGYYYGTSGYLGGYTDYIDTWMNIVAIAGDNNRLTGFCSDGTVITTWEETASWTDFKMPRVSMAELPESVRPVEDGGEEYVFSDPAIEHAVKAQLGENIDVVHAADLADITSLNLGNRRRSINDMSSLYDMPDLTALDMSHGDISDISALSGMTNLSWLKLRINQIGDLNRLSGMTTLEDLELKDNPISDRSPVAGLENTVDIDW